MHIVNSELGRGESSASELTKLMEEMLTIVKYSLKVAINEEDIFFQRFVTHLKFFSERVLLDDNVGMNNDGSGSLKRYKKKSFDWYKEVITSNGAVL